MMSFLGKLHIAHEQMGFRSENTLVMAFRFWWRHPHSEHLANFFTHIELSGTWHGFRVEVKRLKLALHNPNREPRSIPRCHLQTLFLKPPNPLKALHTLGVEVLMLEKEGILKAIGQEFPWKYWGSKTAVGSSQFSYSVYSLWTFSIRWKMGGGSLVVGSSRSVLFPQRIQIQLPQVGQLATSCNFSSRGADSLF